MKLMLTLDGKAGVGGRVLDPLLFQNKGRPSSSTKSITKRKKWCTLCQLEGYTRVTCQNMRFSQADEMLNNSQLST